MAWSGSEIRQPASQQSTILAACDSRFILTATGASTPQFYAILDTTTDTSVAYSQGGMYGNSYSVSRCSYGGNLYISLAAGNFFGSSASLYEIDPYSTPGTLTLIKAGLSTGYRPSAMIGKYFGNGNQICDVTTAATTTISSTYGDVRGAVSGYFICCQTGTTTAHLIKTDGTLHRTFTMRNSLGNQYDTVLNLVGDWVQTAFMIVPTTGMRMVNPFTDATLDVNFAAGLTHGILTPGKDIAGDTNGVLYGSDGVNYPIAFDPLTGRWEPLSPAPTYVPATAAVVGSNVYFPSDKPAPWPGGW